jgi:CRISPR-associated protein Csd1
MLTELYRYAIEQKLAARPGFKPKRPKAYFLLSADGRFTGLSLCEKDAPAVMAPDVGAAAQGTETCNPLIEKAKVCLCIVEAEKDKNIPAKNACFRSYFEQGKASEPLFAAAEKALSDETTLAKMREALKEQRLKAQDPVGFEVDGLRLEQSKRYLDWWDTYRRLFASPSAGREARCLITGDLTEAMPTILPVSGLSAVGGRPTGDRFLCFDKDAFQSFGLKKSANAAVSEEAITAVNAALSKLIAEARTLGGARLVHWYSEGIAPEEDVFLSLLGEDLAEGSEESQGSSGERDALRAAAVLMESVRTGKRPEALNARYYIMPLSGAGGRMMVRGWQEGSYEELYENIKTWFDDLRLILPRGGGTTRAPKLLTLCIRLLKPGGDPRKVISRVNDELPNLSSRLLQAIITGSPLPDEVAARALHWLRSLTYEGGRPDKDARSSGLVNESLVFQLLKAWIIRKQREKGEVLMKEELNRGCTSVAYCCGRLMAVYAAIQERAMEGINVGLAERFYTAASASPGLVIGKLAQQSQYYLGKLDRGAKVFYEKMLTEIYSTVGSQKIPAALTMQDQTEFALGYYQQRADIFKK